MASFGRLPALPSRATLLIALFLLTMFLAGLLAYEAHLVGQSHRVTVERASRDYATICATAVWRRLVLLRPQPCARGWLTW
jgi:hypothetical protein